MALLLFHGFPPSFTAIPSMRGPQTMAKVIDNSNIFMILYISYGNYNISQLLDVTGVYKQTHNVNGGPSEKVSFFALLGTPGARAFRRARAMSLRGATRSSRGLPLRTHPPRRYNQLDPSGCAGSNPGKSPENRENHGESTINGGKSWNITICILGKPDFLKYVPWVPSGTSM